MLDNNKFHYDIFLSYRNKDPYVARSIYHALEKQKGYSVFFDKEKLQIGRYDDKQIIPAIQNATYYVVVLTKQTFDGRDPTHDYLLKEINLAKQYKDEKHILPITVGDFDIQKDLPKEVSWLSDQQKANLTHEEFNECIDKISKYFKDLNTTKGIKHTTKANLSYKKWTPEQAKTELERLKLQYLVFENIDRPIYNEIINKYKNGFTALDVGCSLGGRGMYYFGLDKNCKKFIGIDYNDDIIKSANETYGSKGSFYNVDIEADDFETRLKSIMFEHNLAGFDFINISLVLLHIEKPFRFIQRIKKFLNKNGTILIFDVDDGYNIAYPDDGNLFKTVRQISYDLPNTGNRNTARKIFHFLKTAKYDNIQLKSHLINTVNWDAQKRKSLFGGRINIVYKRLNEIVEKYSNDKTKINEYKVFTEKLQWFKNNYDTLLTKFLDESFFYTCTHTIYTAENLTDGFNQQPEEFVKF